MVCQLARSKYWLDGISLPLRSWLPSPSSGMALARLSARSKSVPPIWTPPLARMSALRSSFLARSGDSRTSEKSEVPPPMSATITSSSPEMPAS
ncbi:hypothetical protein D3C85_1265320 [compost metagenome]